MINDKFIYLQNDINQVPGLLKFQIKPAVITQLREAGFTDINYIFQSISGQRDILVSSRENSKGVLYNLHTRFGVFCFTEVQELDNEEPEHIRRYTDYFLINNYFENSVPNINASLMHGIRFAARYGVVFIIMSKKLDMFLSFCQGDIYDSNEYKNRRGVEAAHELIHICKQERNQQFSDEDTETDTEELTSNFNQLLDKATSYAQLTYEKERMASEKNGLVAYSQMGAVSRKRKDRIAYYFYIEKQEKPAFERGVMVDVLASDSDRGITAEVEKVETNETNDILTLLFTKEVDFNDIQPQGWLRLSASTVNLDVQLSAIEKLRFGTAKAKYLNRVFGKNEFLGFESEDLDELTRRLCSDKYPPNDSQINAIHKGIQTKDIYLVKGPPGTGKTTVILEWAKYFIKEKHWRVLISSQNNKAVDNVLSRLADQPGIEALRIGSEDKVQNDVAKFLFEKKQRNLIDAVSQSTQASMAKLSEALGDWTNYCCGLTELLTSLRLFLDRHKETVQYVNKYLHPYDTKMRRLLKQSTTQVEYINNKKCEMARLLNRYYEYEQATGFARVLYYIPLRILSGKLDRGNESLQDAVYKQNRYATEYNRCSEDLMNNYRYFDEVVLEQYYSVYEDVIDCARRLYTQFPKDVLDIGLYPIRELTEEQLLNCNDLQQYIEEIQQCNNRTRDMLDILDEWSVNMSNCQNYALLQILLDSVNLVGATCIGVSSQRRFQDLDFDVTIIDEAGQIQIHNALVPMSVSPKTIMLGDHMQIPPMADEDVKKLCRENDVETDLLEKSFFEVMFSAFPKEKKTSLDTQYRMPAEIADVISAWFYEGNYKSPDFLRNCKPFLPSLSTHNFLLVNEHIQDGKSLEKSDPNGGYCNPTEAKIVIAIVKHLLDICDKPEEQIGIIFPYKAQVNLVRKELRKINPYLADCGIVASLDSFQGQERDVIIYGFTRSSLRKSTKGRIGFLKELRRINVAMSRCKKFLVMLGDYDFLGECEKTDATNVIYSEDGSHIINGSEATFSEFIQVLRENVERGNGEMIDMNGFMQRIGE